MEIKQSIRDILNTFNKPFLDFRQKLEDIKHPAFSKEKFINVNGILFNFSLVVDDLNEFSDFNNNFYVYNLCFAEIENENPKHTLLLKNHFPTFIKIQEKLKNRPTEFFIGENVEQINNEEEDALLFKDVISFGKYLISIMNKSERDNLLNDFYNEIIKYLESIKLFEIDDSGIVEVYSNSGKKQTVLIKTIKGTLYKISILSESYESQSYAKLYVKDSSGFSLIKNCNPKRDYNIELSYKKDYSKNSFSKIISDFKDLIIKIEK
jgi:hypothetical protein